MLTPQKRVRSVSLDDRSSIPPGLSTLLDAADRLNVFADITNASSMGVLLDAATSVAAKQPRLSEISDDERLDIVRPSPEELAEATTFRSRSALEHWYGRLRELYEYKALHHNCLVPQKYPPNPALGIWVNKQRMEKKLLDQGHRSAMTQYRLDKLNQAGFVWAKPKGDVSWDTKYAELCAFHAKHGHCMVPTKFSENTALGRWISTQRAQYKEWKQNRPTHMTPERYDKLCALHFQFECSKSEVHW